MKDVRERLGETIMKMTPNDANSIMKELNMKKKKKWYEVFKPAYALTLVLFLAVGIVGTNTINANKIYSIISLDVNPSIEINVNAKDKVISVNAYNEDAKTIVGDMDFKGSSLEVTVNALIGSLLRNGYLSDTANSILVTVDGKDADKNKKIEEELVEEIEEILSSSNLNAAVLSQVLDKDDTIEKYSEDYGISKGKATLIYDIINSENNTHTFEELIPLTINELNLLVSSPKVELNKVKSNGQTASEKSYIGKDVAKQNALTKLGINENDIYDYEIELDYEHAVMVYEIEFKIDNLEYDVKVNALDGSIVHYYSEVDDDEVKTTTPTNITNYNQDQVKQIVTNKANVNNITDYEIELDDGKYEVSFKADGIEYEYEIDPATGKILKEDKEIDDDYKGENPQQITANYSKEEAKQIALNNAGVNKAYDYEVEYDDGKYEVSFKSDGVEYEYEIDPSTGNIINQEKEIDDDDDDHNDHDWDDHDDDDDDDDHDWDDDDDDDDDDDEEDDD